MTTLGRERGGSAILGREGSAGSVISSRMVSRATGRAPAGGEAVLLTAATISTSMHGQRSRDGRESTALPMVDEARRVSNIARLLRELLC